VAAKGAVLRCLLCGEKYTEEDVRTLTFFPETSGCYDCYRRMSKSPFSRTCFGKLNVVSNGTIKHFGYDPQVSLDCSFHCPHRKVCKLFAEKRIKKLRAKLLTPFECAVADVFRLALKGTKSKRFYRAVKKARGSLLKLRSQLRWVLDEKKRAVKLYWVNTIRRTK